jgi:hypothetical protein
MVTRLNRDDRALLNRLSSVFASLAMSPLAGTVENDLRVDLDNSYLPKKSRKLPTNRRVQMRRMAATSRVGFARLSSFTRHN